MTTDERRKLQLSDLVYHVHGGGFVVEKNRFTGKLGVVTSKELSEILLKAAKYYSQLDVPTILVDDVSDTKNDASYGQRLINYIQRSYNMKSHYRKDKGKPRFTITVKEAAIFNKDLVKFGHLRVGAPFLYEGSLYVKSGFYVEGKEVGIEVKDQAIKFFMFDNLVELVKITKFDVEYERTAILYKE